MACTAARVFFTRWFISCRSRVFCSSARRRAVSSRMTLMRPRGGASAPRAGSRSGIISPFAQNREPSLRWCQRSSATRPSRTAPSDSRAGAPLSRSSGVKITSAGRPTISPSAQPSSRSAPAFHQVMRRRGSMLKIA